MRKFFTTDERVGKLFHAFEVIWLTGAMGSAGLGKERIGGD